MFTNQEGTDMDQIERAKQAASILNRSSSEWVDAEYNALRAVGPAQYDDLLALAQEKQRAVWELIDALENLQNQ